MSNIDDLSISSIIVVFRVGDSGVIQGRDSGCDSEGVKREKRVNR